MNELQQGRGLNELQQGRGLTELQQERGLNEVLEMREQNEKRLNHMMEVLEVVVALLAVVAAQQTDPQLELALVEKPKETHIVLGGPRNAGDVNRRS